MPTQEKQPTKRLRDEFRNWLNFNIRLTRKLIVKVPLFFFSVWLAAKITGALPLIIAFLEANDRVLIRTVIIHILLVPFFAFLEVNFDDFLSRLGWEPSSRETHRTQA